ncbi:MAG: hypothetical protein S4CHLAM7_12940 [Chlamydiae bacterium]|nr:hypothetical protein [Chlamydiota bacterium]
MRRLYRSRYDKKIVGLCGGLGSYCRLDPVIVRLLFIFVCALTGFVPIVLVYLLASAFIPLEPKNSPAFEFRRLYRSTNNRILAGICGGLSKLIKVDATVLRLIMVVITLTTLFAPMTIAYLVGWFIIPEKKL